MARDKRNKVVRLLVGAGAGEPTAEAIVQALERADLDPGQMVIWLSHPNSSHSVATAEIDGVQWRVTPTHAIEDGHADTVLAAAEAFAAAPPEDRWICLTLGCHLEQAQKLTQGDAKRTALVLEVLTMLRKKLRKPETIYETIQQTLSGDFEDETRLVDWMLDERLADARDALASGRIDPKALRKQDGLLFIGW